MGAQKLALVVVNLVMESPWRAASHKPYGKGPIEPETQGADRRAVGSWGKTTVVWPNPKDLEGRAKFILDEPIEAYFWKGLEETGCASMKAINQVVELMGRDLYNSAQVWALG